MGVAFCLFDLIFYFQSTIFQLRREVFMCIAQGHNAATPVRIEPTALRSPVKHSTTEPLCSHIGVAAIFVKWPKTIKWILHQTAEWFLRKGCLVSSPNEWPFIKGHRSAWHLVLIYNYCLIRLINSRKHYDFGLNSYRKWSFQVFPI